MRVFRMLPVVLLAALPIAGAAAQASAAIAGDAAEYRLTAPAPAPAPSRARAAAEIEAAAQRYAPVVRHCYQEEGLKSDPTLAGILHVSIAVGPGGDVHSPHVTVTQARGVGMPAVVSCVAAATASWHFAAGPFREEHVGLSFRLVAPDRS